MARSRGESRAICPGGTEPWRTTYFPLSFPRGHSIPCIHVQTCLAPSGPENGMVGVKLTNSFQWTYAGRRPPPLAKGRGAASRNFGRAESAPANLHKADFALRRRRAGIDAAQYRAGMCAIASKSFLKIISPGGLAPYFRHNVGSLCFSWSTGLARPISKESNYG